MNQTIVAKIARRAERVRCAGLLSQAMTTLKEAVPPSLMSHWELVSGQLEQLHQDIRRGKKLPAPKVRKRARTVCSYCDGEEQPEGHNKATCRRRFADLAAQATAEATRAGASS